MGRTLFLIAILFVAFFPATAQTDVYTAPVKWERHRVTFRKISVMFPKMPVAIESSDPCSELAQHTYVAYAREVVYTFVFSYKIHTSQGDFCPVRRHFGRKYFDSRIAELAQMKDASVPEKLSLNGRPAVIISADSTKHWLIDDIKNDRWFELSISNRPDAKPDETTFVNSLTTDEETGVEIGNGAERTLGDAGTTVPVTSVEGKTNPLVTEPFLLRFKPKANYTDAARQNNVTGTVRLKLALLSHGGVGAITTVSELPYGLTEQAIAVAKRIVFIPKKVNGVNVSVIVTFDYVFNIY